MKSYFTIALLCTISFIQGQDIGCGFDEVERASYPSRIDYSNGYDRLNKQLAHAHTQERLTKTATVDTFDLVFHVIHLGEPLGTGSNISTTQILSTVEGLNRDFRALPIHDSIAISPYGTDSEIQFRVACKDPNGEATDGIVRVDGSSVANYKANGIEIATPEEEGNIYDVMDLSRWPEDQYINIYITHAIQVISNGNQIGAAGMGPISLWWEHGIGGVYLTPTTVGVDVDGSLGYDISNPYGKLPSHEMGHFFGLWHTFQGMSCTETDCTVQGDGVCDTEPHDNSSPYPMDTTCDEYNECTTREPVENLMNYAAQTCGHVFTPGQKSRIKEIINQYLISLAKTPPCDGTLHISAQPDPTPFELFPNPFNNSFTISSAHDGVISVFNMQGQPLFHANITKGFNDITLDHLPSGVYFVTSHQGQHSHTVLAIKH